MEHHGQNADQTFDMLLWIMLRYPGEISICAAVQSHERVTFSRKI
jgi:hypothetical protein